MGAFYSRFENKDALLGTLFDQLARETRWEIEEALAADWSRKSMRELLTHVAARNAKIYAKYRGVLAVVYVSSRMMPLSGEDEARVAYNEGIVSQMERLLLQKRNEIVHGRPRVAIRTAIACMSAMLRDAIVFGDASLYPQPRDTRSIARRVADVMHRYLVAEDLSR